MRPSIILSTIFATLIVANPLQLTKREGDALILERDDCCCYEGGQYCVRVFFFFYEYIILSDLLTAM